MLTSYDLHPLELELFEGWKGDDLVSRVLKEDIEYDGLLMMVRPKKAAIEIIV